MVDWGCLEDERLRRIVRRALEHVRRLEREGKSWRSFEAYEIRAEPWLLRKLVYDCGIFKIVYKSSSHTLYAFDVLLEEVEEKLKEYEVLFGEPVVVSSARQVSEKVEIPPDFWSTVEGYDDLKELFIASIRSDKPVHILLVGPPGTAKTLMLMEVERLPSAVFVTAGTATRAGIRDILLNYRPRFLIIDELDKITNPDDLSVLLTLMESQRVIVARHREYREEHVKTWVFAAANTTRGMPPELLDRFWKVYLKPYDRETLIRVVKSCLIKLEGVQEDLAGYIAQRVAEMDLSVRDAIRIARISKTKEDADRFLELVKRYSRTI